MRLMDIGERKILDDLILSKFPTLRDQYDDCAIVKVEDMSLLFSTDPAPEPVAFQFGYKDYYYYGWLTVVVNLSDIAAMGGIPIGMLIATVMNPQMELHDYDRFLSGVKDACTAWNCPLLGGNVKDGMHFTANGFIIGQSSGRVLTQTNANEGDLICVVGDMGLFWSAVITEHHNSKDRLSESEYDQLFHSLTAPVAMVKEGQILAQHGYATSCSDCSDGITWNIIDIARKSQVDLVIKAAEICVDSVVAKVCDYNGYNTENVALSGGGYQLVCTVNPRDVSRLRKLLSDIGTPLSTIGYAKAGTGKALIYRNGIFYNLCDIASERFHPSSLFTHGYQSYLSVLKDGSIYGEKLDID